MTLPMPRKNSSPTIALLSDALEIPPGIDGLEEFRRWSQSGAFPPTGRIDWIAGRIEVDMSPEDLYTHGSPKTAIATALSQEIYVPRKGLVFIDATRITSPAADLSAEPDVLVLLERSLGDGRARLVEKTSGEKTSGEKDRFVEIEGAVDLVVECVSDSSATKDQTRLRALYHAAGIPEYWVIDARREAIEFQLLLRAENDFVRAPADDEGFARSALLERGVRLVRTRSAAGLVFYALELEGRGARPVTA